GALRVGDRTLRERRDWLYAAIARRALRIAAQPRGRIAGFRASAGIGILWISGILPAVAGRGIADRGPGCGALPVLRGMVGLGGWRNLGPALSRPPDSTDASARRLSPRRLVAQGGAGPGGAWPGHRGAGPAGSVWPLLRRDRAPAREGARRV